MSTADGSEEVLMSLLRSGREEEEEEEDDDNEEEEEEEEFNEAAAIGDRREAEREEEMCVEPGGEVERAEIWMSVLIISGDEWPDEVLEDVNDEAESSLPFWFSLVSSSSSLSLSSSKMSLSGRRAASLWIVFGCNGDKVG